MTHAEFETACAQQNRERAERIEQSRTGGTPCDVVTMYALGGIGYCRTHAVMGECPYGHGRAGA